MKRILLTILILLFLGSGAAAYWAYKDLHRPAHHDRSAQYINIPRGSTPTAVVRRLAAEGVIKHEWPMLFYIPITGAVSRLKAGEYVFPPPIRPSGVLRKLEQGEHRVMRLTIIEG